MKKHTHDNAVGGVAVKPAPKRNRRCERSAFTVIEILVVIVILGIAAMLSVPMFSSAAQVQLRSAANTLAADMDYVKNLAITHQKKYTVVFNTGSEAYEVRDTDAWTVIDHPVKAGFPFVVNFATDTRTNRVDIASADFDGVGNHSITFDYLGSPYAGQDTTSPLNSGTVRLQADGHQTDVNVEPITGYVAIQ